MMEELKKKTIDQRRALDGFKKMFIEARAFQGKKYHDQSAQDI
jgi:hypothetical protein